MKMRDSSCDHGVGQLVVTIIAMNPLFTSPGCSYFAGIQINNEKLAQFVEHVDKDNNGIIRFEEWRDFLLLFPHGS